MNSGKSSHLLQTEFNFTNIGKKTLLLKPLIDTRQSNISSRVGISKKSKNFKKDENLYKRIKNMKNKPNSIFIDECQFATNKTILSLRKVVDKLGIEVYVYGLKTNFKGKLFEGSKKLFEISDKLIEISTLCHCGKIMNFLYWG